MNIFSNITPSVDKGSGSAPGPVKTAVTAAKDATAGAEPAADNAGAAAAPKESGALFQLLLGQAAQPAAATSSTTAEADKTPTTPPDGAAPDDLNRFIALLPGLAPPVPAAMPDAKTEPTAMAAATPSPTAPVTSPLPTLTLGAAPAAAAATESSPLATLATTLLTDTATATKPETAPKTDFATAMLQSVEHALGAPTTTAAPVTASVSSSASSTPAMRVDVPMHYPEWPEAVGHRLLWAVNDGIQKADLHINPEHLGPVHVKIHLDNDKADIQFAAATPQAREALETSIPKLREMFAQQGLDLHQAQVFSQTSQNPNGRQPQGSAVPNGNRTQQDEPMDAPAVPVRVLRQSLRLLDDYA